MKKISLAFLATGLLLAACNKRPTNGEAQAQSDGDGSVKAAAACVPNMFQLVVDPGTGFSYLFRVTGSPTAGPITVTPILGSAGTNQLTDCSGTPIKFATGISFEPTTGTFYGTTGVAPSSPVNNILKFTDPNCVGLTPAVTTCGIALNLSDVERNPVTGVYYAINRGTANPNNRIVRLGLPGSPTVNCLPTVLSPSLFLRGLTITQSGRLYVAAVNGTGARLLDINTASGAITATYSYPGPVTPGPGVAAPEMGLHHDSLCVNRFITANYDPVGPPVLFTDGIPSGLPGGPVYAAVSGVLKPTVDFSRQ